MVPRHAPACAARARNIGLVHGSIAACLLASLAGCAQILGIDDLSPRSDAGTDADGGPGDGGGPPPAPALRTPMNGSRMGSLLLPSSRRPTFAWEAVAGATYVLEYSTEPTFTAVTRVESSVPSYQPPEDLPVGLEAPVGARYHWRVSTCIGTRCSMPSRSWYFDVARLRPDVNGDGYDDVLVGASINPEDANLPSAIYAYTGGAGQGFDMQSDGEITSSFAGGEQLGESVALGDFDGDGFAEIVGGIPRRLDGSGGFHVFPGSTGSPAVIDGFFAVLGQVPGTSFGITLTAGDFNADGFADLVVGDVGPGASGDQLGHLSVYLGDSGGIDGRVDQTLVGSEVNDGFGGVVANGGDINGDGYEDLLVGVPGARRVNVHFGAPGLAFQDQPSAVLSAPDVPNFPTAVAGAGDVDGDGYHDVLVGSPDTVHLYRGGPGAFDTEPDATLGGLGQSGVRTVVSSAGDMDGDGRAEAAIGFSSDPASWGIALYSSTFGPLAEQRVTLGLNGDIGGAALSRPADFNGDGLSDVVMTGGPNADVHVFLGGDFVVPRTVVLQPGTDVGFGASIAP